jgi:UDP-glucose 4-epimerase
VNVLVSGGAGFVGSHVVDALVGAGHTVAVVDSLVTGRRELVNARARLHVVDLRDGALASAVESARPEVVVHAAAQPSVARSVADPIADASVNVLGTIALLEQARRTGVRRFVYISTGGAGYGDTDVIPTPESHPARPVSPYGISKITGERYVELWRDMTGAEAVVLRLANVYGPRQSPEGEAGVVAIFTQRALSSQPCVVNGDGEQTRDFVYVGDVAAAVLRAVEVPGVHGILNIGTGRATSVNEILKALAHALGRPVPSQHAPARPGEQRRSVLDARLAETQLGWRATTWLADGLRLTVEHARLELDDVV